MNDDAAGLDWERIQSLGLHKDIRSLQDYDAKVASNGLVLRACFAGGSEVVPTLATIKAAHLQTFDRVHAWAGELRRPDLVPNERGDVLIGRGEAPPWQSVEAELKALKTKAEGWFAKAETILEKATAIAAYHAEFERIHPFIDGNGRVGRALMEAQITQCFGVAPTSVPERESYLKAFQAIERSHNYKPLTEIVLQCSGQKLNADMERIDNEMKAGEQAMRAVLEQAQKAQQKIC